MINIIPVPVLSSNMLLTLLTAIPKIKYINASFTFSDTPFLSSLHSNLTAMGYKL